MNADAISPSELTPLGMGRDHQADLFAAGDTVLRAVRPGSTPLFEKLLEHPAVRRAIDDRLLVPARRAPRGIRGCGLVIEHPRIPFTTYPFEWTPSMFKAASLCVLRLNLRLMEHGFCLMDAHPWNICFDGTNPLFVDFTSIVELPAEAKWERARDFELNCLHPLELMEKGYPTLARALLRDPVAPFAENVSRALLPHPERLAGGLRGRLDAVAQFVGSRIARRLDRRVRHGDRSATRAELEAMARQIEAMRVEPVSGNWKEYYSGRDEASSYPATREEFASARKSTPKPAIVGELLARCRPATVLDIGCNRGFYSQIAALDGARVLGLDTDEWVLDQMFRDSRALGSGALPLFVDATAPVEPVSPAHRPMPPARERLRADCVLALAVVHHIVFGPTKMGFDDVAALLASYANDAVVVEFVPREDAIVAKWFTQRTPEFAQRFTWYSLENFEAALAKQFASIERHASHPETRTIFFCRRRAA